MALLEAVVFPRPPDHSAGLPCCVLRGHGVPSAGEFEGIIKMGVVVQEDGEPVVTPPHGSAACCAWAGGSAISWAIGAIPSALATSSSSRRPAVRPQPAVRRPPRHRRGTTIAKAARRSVAEAESLRQNHIAVERNRRRQMNEYLAALRTLMPPSYARRGDQASIVGGAIDFVKELEHRLQTLQAQKRPAAADAAGHGSERFPGFFTIPQYSTAAAANVVVVDDASSGGENSRSTTRPGVADVEAAVSEGHATVKVLAPRRRQMLLSRLLIGMQRRGLAALHLNVSTTPDQMVLYTVSLKMGDMWQLSSAGDDVAATVHDIVAGMHTAEDLVI